MKRGDRLKITVLGVIQALKNLGLFFMSYQIAEVKAAPGVFLYALVIYALISVPTDLYLLNKAHEDAKETE